MSDPNQPNPDAPAMMFYDAGESEREEEQVEILLEGKDEIPVEPVESELPEEYKDLTKEEIFKKYQESVSTLEKQQSEGDRLSRSIEELGQKLVPPKKEEEPNFQQQQQPLPEEKINLEEDLFKNPQETLDKYINQKLAPLVRDQYSSLFHQQREVEKLKEPEVFKKYGSDIDKRFQMMSGQDKISGGYSEAVKRVKADHLDEILQEEITAKMETMKQELKEELLKGTPAKPVDYTEGYSPAPKPPNKPKRIVLSKEQQRYADERGLSYADYADILRRRGKNG